MSDRRLNGPRPQQRTNPAWAADLAKNTTKTSRIKPFTKRKARRGGRGISVERLVTLIVIPPCADFKGAMRKPFEVSDMPPLTVDMHQKLRILERSLNRELGVCCNHFDLLDPEAAFEYARTYAVRVFDCYYEFYSHYPSHKTHWSPASERFALQRVIQCIENNSAVWNTQTKVIVDPMEGTCMSATSHGPVSWISVASLSRPNSLPSSQVYRWNFYSDGKAQNSEETPGYSALDS